MPEYIRPLFPPKNKPVSSPAVLAAFKKAHPFCQACGREEFTTLHHILGGRCGRSDEAANLLALCWTPCHQLAEKLDIRVNGYLLPKLTIGIALSLKLRAGELTAADLARLQELNGKRLPDPEPIPVEFDRAYRLNRGEAQHG